MCRFTMCVSGGGGGGGGGEGGDKLKKDRKRVGLQQRQ